MHRTKKHLGRDDGNLPHARGDEPNFVCAHEVGHAICPTHVGMNRQTHCPCPAFDYLPHARGDEPIIATVVATAIIFAPRTWGEIFKRGWIK